jgi:hypothetical protein
MTTTEFLYELEKAIVAEALDSPVAAMMRLTYEIEKQLRLLLAATGQIQHYTGLSPIAALDLLAKSVVKSSFPQSLRVTIETFWVLRNEVVHGSDVRQRLALRAVDYGVQILKMLSAIPRRRYVVVHNAVEIFEDQEGRIRRPDVNGVILWTLFPGDEKEATHIFPTRRNYFAGTEVSWEWDLRGPGWGQSWYRDPMTNKIEFAWSGCLEFIGRPIDEI